MTERADPRFSDDDVRLAYVSGIHGIRGEVKLFVYNPSSDVLPTRRRVVLVAPDGQRHEVGIVVRQGAGRRVLAKLDGVCDRQAADDLKGTELVVAAAQLPQAEPGSWYHRDLIGLPVWTQGGRQLGRITEIHSTGEVDVWMIQGANGIRALPVLKALLVDVSLPQGDVEGRVVVTDDAVDEAPPI